MYTHIMYVYGTLLSCLMCVYNTCMCYVQHNILHTVHTHTHTHTHTHLHTKCARTHTHTSTQNAHAHTHTHTSTQNAHAHTHTHTHLHKMRTHAHTHTHTHTSTQNAHAHTTHRIIFTVVSDPEDVEDDCVEIGNAELDLRAVRVNNGPGAFTHDCKYFAGTG